MDIVAWLEEVGFPEHSDAFVENGVDLDLLPELTNDDLKDLGVARLADRKRLLKAIGALVDGRGAGAAPPNPARSEERDWTGGHGERRPVTVLFADLANFTGISAKIGAERTHAVLNAYFARVDRIIEGYGGRIDKHIGDSAMAVFGAPVAHTNDPERAARAALDIHAAMSGLSAELGEGLAVHVGIASGQVVASGTGSDSHREFTVTGDTVNLASRLDDLAGPGETFVSGAIREALREMAGFTARGAARIKGFQEPIPVWSLDRLLEKPDGKPAGRFVGRQLELSQFAAGLEGCRSGGHGHGVLVRGDPGIGKSRLIAEFIARAEAQGFAAHRGHVLDFGVETGRDAIRALVQSLIGLDPGSDDGARRAGAERAMADGWIDERQRPFLDDLLDLEQPPERWALYRAMDDQMRTRGRHDVFAALIQGAAATMPALVVVEDIHWADQVVRDYLSAAARAARDAPAVLVLTSRMEGPALDHGWLSSIAACSIATIDLQPLRAAEASELARVLGDEQGEAIEQLIERAGGNPLFLEQLIRNVAERSQEDLPDTLHGVVLSRVDGLARTDRETLQAASVLGQRFSVDALTGVMGAVAVDCTALFEHRLLRGEGAELVFAHALIRDGVYASLLGDRKRELHGIAARWYAGRDHALRAEHLDRAEDPGAARAYLEAAEAEAAQFHYKRALRHSQRGIELAEGRADRFALLHARGTILHDSLDLPGALAAFEEALTVAEGPAERCRALIGIASVMRLIDRMEEALPLLDEAQVLAEGLAMDEELSALHHLRGNLYFPLGRPDDCFIEHEKALAHARKAGSSEAEVRALGGLGDAEYARGRMRAAHGYFCDCLELSRRHGYTRIEIANANMVGGGGTHYYLNDLDAAWQASSDAAAKGERVGMIRAALLGHVSLSMVAFDRGAFDASAEHAETVRRMAEEIGTRRFVARAIHHFGKLDLRRGDREAAVLRFRESMAISRETGIGYIGASILASLARATTDPVERAAALEEGEALLAKGCVSHNYFEFYTEAADLMLEEGDWSEAERYAAALEDFTRAEPLPRSDFIIARARALAAFGAGDRSEGVRAELQRLLAEADRIGLAVARMALADALA